MTELTSTAVTAAPTDPLVVLQDPDFARRFGGVARLYGPRALERFSQARVCVVGLGGVGSWTVEALARSAVGHLTLIDLDHVALSNMNRQIHALETTLGQAKVQACLERIALINPSCSVTAIDEFVSPENVARLLGGAGFDFVVDASDDVKAKVAIAVFCRERGIALVSIGAAGGQRDATRVRVADLAHTQHEPLLARVRKRLRSQHGFSRNLKARFGIAAVYSDEPVANPWQTAATVDLQPVADGAPPDRADSAGPSLDAPSRAAGGATGLNCAGFGSSVAVTAVFGMVAAGFVLEELARRLESAAGS